MDSDYSIADKIDNLYKFLVDVTANETAVTITFLDPVVADYVLNNADAIEDVISVTIREVCDTKRFVVMRIGLLPYHEY